MVGRFIKRRRGTVAGLCFLGALLVMLVTHHEAWWRWPAVLVLLAGNVHFNWTGLREARMRQDCHRRDSAYNRCLLDQLVNGREDRN